MTTKTQNWNEETTALLVATYANGETAIEQVAKVLEKTVPAVRSKLVSLGVYKKQEQRAVGGASAVRKINLVKELAEALEVEMALLESLEKASKPALELLLKKLSAE